MIRSRVAATTLATLGAASLVGAATGLAPASAGEPAALDLAAHTRVHFQQGKPLTAASSDAAARIVSGYLKTHGGAARADGLRTVATWTARGVQQARLEQYAAGLRVHGSYAKAAVDAKGRLVSLIEDTAATDAAPLTAEVDEAAALRSALAHLYPTRSASTADARRSGNTVSFAQQGLVERPRVERVAARTTAGRLAEAFEVTTWADDALRVTLVDGRGKVLDSELRTQSDSYNIFPVDPSTTPQTVTAGAGWVTGGPQTTREITSNNAHAYLDANNDNAPDAGGTPVTNNQFTSVYDPSLQPTAGANPDVAVQNLAYLNNLIHDTLYRAGFTEAAGNFQTDNFGRGGSGGDPVQAEAQDGGGTDNANFSTPADGSAPRMQMYLWNAPVTHEVVAGGAAYDATGASWGAQLSATGVTGPLALGSPADGCSRMAKVPVGSVVVVDRGSCDFTAKALNAQSAGAGAVVIANNQDSAIFTMGGSSNRVKIGGVMVSKADGAALKAKAGSSAQVHKKDPAPIMADGDLDSDIVWHEYGHGLTWRMIGRMDGPLAGAIGEGMADVLSVVINDDPEVGEYSVFDGLGIRRYSYEGYPLTYGSVAGSEVHDDGEIYGAIGWDLWKKYRNAGLSKDTILADLVNGMNYTPAAPSYEQMRDGILSGIAATPDTADDARACTVWSSFAKFGVGVGAKGTVRGKSAVVTESFAVPAACQP